MWPFPSPSHVEHQSAALAASFVCLHVCHQPPETHRYQENCLEWAPQPVGSGQRQGTRKRSALQVLLLAVLIYFTGIIVFVVILRQREPCVERRFSRIPLAWERLFQQWPSLASLKLILLGGELGPPQRSRTIMGTLSSIRLPSVSASALQTRAQARNAIGNTAIDVPIRSSWKCGDLQTF